MSSPSRSQALQRRYTFEFELGIWTFGSNQVVKDRKTGTQKTCKSVIKAWVKDPDDVCARLTSLKDLSHPQVSSICDIIEDAEHIYIISDRCTGGDLNDWMDQLDEQHWLQEEIIAAYIGQALVALAYCHANHVYHHDLSPSSIMLTSRLPDARVMVSDFGLQAILDPDNKEARRNPSPYVAPELISDAGRVLGGGAPDVWSIGAIAHLLLVGKEPGTDASWDLGPGNFLLGLRDGSEWAERSSASRDFVQRLLQPAGHRPTAARMLQHPWLRNTIIPRTVRGRPGHEDIHHKMFCYMVAVLLAPALLPRVDFASLRQAFKEEDDDLDGLVLRSIASDILQEHSLHETTPETFGADEIEDALEIADVRGTGIIDLCTAAVAVLLAHGLPKAGKLSAKGPSRASELAPLLTERFFEVYGKRNQPTVDATRLILQLRNATGRELESFGGVDYDEVLMAFADHAVIDRHLFASKLSAHAGRGTPLSYAQDQDSSVCDDDTESSWEPFEGIGDLLGEALESCGLLPSSKRKWLMSKLMDYRCAQCISIN